MSDGEREVDVRAINDRDAQSSDNMQNAGDASSDWSPVGLELREAAAPLQSDGARISVDDLDPTMGAWRNRDYGEVM